MVRPALTYLVRTLQRRLHPDLTTNVPVHVIQALLGHATLDTVMVYAKLYPTTLIGSTGRQSVACTTRFTAMTVSAIPPRMNGRRLPSAATAGHGHASLRAADR